MDKSAFTDIDPDVVNLIPVDGEEHDVSGAWVTIALDRGGGLFARGPRDILTGLAVGALDQGGAVEPIGVGAAIAIWRVEVSERRQYDFGALQLSFGGIAHRAFDHLGFRVDLERFRCRPARLGTARTPGQYERSP